MYVLHNPKPWAVDKNRVSKVQRKLNKMKCQDDAFQVFESNFSFFQTGQKQYRGTVKRYVVLKGRFIKKNFEYPCKLRFKNRTGNYFKSIVATKGQLAYSYKNNMY